jgi:transcriptional regulator with XRE-family HTH domain
MLDDACGWRLAEMRKRRGMTQEQVAVRMGVSIARISQIERGDVSTQDVLNRYVSALGGTLKLIADFGDEQLKIARTGDHRPVPGPGPLRPQRQSRSWNTHGALQTSRRRPDLR